MYQNAQARMARIAHNQHARIAISTTRMVLANGDVKMDATNMEIFVLLVALLGFGSSLIHYSAYAKTKAKVTVKSELKK